MRITALIALLIIFSASTISAQRSKNKDNTSNQTQRRIDTLLKPIPVKRSLWHDNIDNELINIDKLDGRYDGEVSNYRGPVTDGAITNDILRRATSLKAFIENQTFSNEEGADHNFKVKYLRKVEFGLKDFYRDAYDGTFDINLWKDMFNTLESFIIAAKDNKTEEFVRNNLGMGLYVNKSLIEDNPTYMNLLINHMCTNYPDMMEERLGEIANYDGACAVMSNMAKKNVGRVYSAATSTNYERDIVARCSDPLVKGIYDLSRGIALENRTRGLVFLSEYVNGKRSIAEIQRIVSNNEEYYKALVALHLDETIADKGKIDKDLRYEALNFVRIINELHDENNLDIRFKSISKFTAQELYYLAVLCSDELYTSSFTKGVFRLIKQKMGMPGDQYLASVKEDKFRSFIRICANYNTLDSFLYTMPQANSERLMSRFVKGLGNTSPVDLEGSTDVADAIGSINNPILINNLQEEVRLEYEQNYLNNNREGTSVYFILYTLLNSKQDGYDDSLFNAVLVNKLQMQPINKMPFARMVSSGKNAVYEQIFFYGDKDGQDSYGNFKSYISKFPNLKIDESNKYWIKIYAVGSKVPFEIYANKPLPEPEDEEAQRKLADYLTAQNINPSILVHRGHSYHLPTTLGYVSPEHKVIILGSCGGYQNLSAILSRSEDAQIVSTKQVGTMQVTDPILRELHAAVMNGQEVDWTAIWKKLDKEMVGAVQRDLFNDYIPPHKNLGALFLKAYKTLSQIKM